MMKNSILIIDDDKENCKRIKYHLQNDRNDVYYATSVHDGLKCLLTQDYTMLIMNVFLGELDGMLLLKEIRQIKNLPILAITPEDDPQEKSRAIYLGADDYLAKPQEMKDLEDYMLRAQSLMRRYTKLNNDNWPTRPTNSVVSYGSLTMYPDWRTAFFNGKLLDLTRKEYDMLKLFAESPGRVYTYGQIYAQVWNEEYIGSVNIISKHISRLRKKEPRIKIEAVHNLGYRLK